GEHGDQCRYLHHAMGHDPTSRRRRRAKTDKIDGEALVRALLAYKRGEPQVCAMVGVPSVKEEDHRIGRERRTAWEPGGR
ncbi:MAG: hypothetical protein E5X24_10720, partial [Mesorhizobium sp.]